MKHKLVKIFKKKRKFALILLMINTFFQINLISQDIPFVEMLKFEETTKHYVQLPEGTILEDIHPYDIPLMEPKEEVNIHSQYLDNEGNPQEDILLKATINCYEDWEGLGNKWLINQDGISSYKSSTPKGNNYSFIRTIPHTGMSNAFYTLNKESIGMNGYLASKVYPPQLLSQLKSTGHLYSITSNAQVVVQNEETTYTIYSEGSPFTITEVVFNDNNNNPIDFDNISLSNTDIERITISTFGQGLCDQFLIMSKIEISRDILLNGLCVKKVIETYYDNYLFNCTDNNVLSRNQLANTDIETNNNTEIFIHPNPLNDDFLFLTIPNSMLDKNLIVELKSIQGRLLKKIKINQATNQLPISVGDFIQQDGLYLLSVKDDQQTFTKKFYYFN